jgi:L-threonylcarbamoyladenylate synthase
MNDLQLRQAARIIRAGGVVAYPTEAVFGLGCDPFNALAVADILSIKGRDPAKGLIVIAAESSQLYDLVEFPDDASRRRVLKTWPGPVTWILPARPRTPAWLTGRHRGLAVRVSGHPLASALCRLAGPIVSTSANLSGHRSCRDALAVRRALGDSIDYLLPGTVGGAAGPSEIRNATTGRVIRAGSRT